MAPKLSESVHGLRAAGNQSFRNGQFSEAATLYSRALQLMKAQGMTLPPPLFSPPKLLLSPISLHPIYADLALSLPSWVFSFPDGRLPHQAFPPHSLPFPVLAFYEKLPWLFLPFFFFFNCNMALLLVLFHLMTYQKHFCIHRCFITFLW